MTDIPKKLTEEEIVLRELMQSPANSAAYAASIKLARSLGWTDEQIAHYLKPKS